MKTRIAIILSVLALAMNAQAETLVVKPDAEATPKQIAIISPALASADHGQPYTVGIADLNGDGKPDLIAHFTSDDECSPSGLGCPGAVTLSSPKGYATLSLGLPLFGATITVLPSMHNGMHDIKVDDSKHIFTFIWSEYQ